MDSIHEEIEIKYDVDDAFELPSLIGLVAGHEGVTEVVEGEAGRERLSATYFDTRDHRLAAAHLTLRRRTGGQDAGWHLKVPGAGCARNEVRVPLGRATVTVPVALRNMVWALTRGEPLAPVATIVTDRTVRHLVDATGQVLVEAADDRVRAERLAGTASEVGQVSRWREIEVELRGGDRGWFDAVNAGLRDLGVSVSEASSKLARVLTNGDGVPAPAGQKKLKLKPPSPKSPAGDVVLDYVKQQVEQILSKDPQVRIDAPGSVHQMRVATRPAAQRTADVQAGAARRGRHASACGTEVAGRRAGRGTRRRGAARPDDRSSAPRGPERSTSDHSGTPWTSCLRPTGPRTTNCSRSWTPSATTRSCLTSTGS